MGITPGWYLGNNDSISFRSTTMSKNKYSNYNWEQIQKFYDKCHSPKLCREHFNYSRRLEWTAEKKGDLVLKPPGHFIKQKVIVICLTCGRQTSNLKYCSRVCASIINNKRFPKIKKASTTTSNFLFCSNLFKAV